MAQIVTGLHPSDLELSADQRTLYVANANSDTVSVIDVGAQRVVETIAVAPDPGLAFGSAPNAISLSKDGRKLFVANGGNNAVAVVALAQSPGGKGRVDGFIPTAWYPVSSTLKESLHRQRQGFTAQTTREKKVGTATSTWAQ